MIEENIIYYLPPSSVSAVSAVASASASSVLHTQITIIATKLS